MTTQSNHIDVFAIGHDLGIARLTFGEATALLAIAETAESVGIDIRQGADRQDCHIIASAMELAHRASKRGISPVAVADLIAKGGF